MMLYVSDWNVMSWTVIKNVAKIMITNYIN